MMPVLYISLTKDRFIQSKFLALPGRTVYPNIVDKDVDKHYIEICSKQIDESIKSFIHKMIMTIAFTVGAAALPTYQAFKQHTKVETIGLKVPFTEENSDGEFFFNLFVAGNVLGHGFFGYLANEIGLSIADDYVAISPQILEYNFHKFFIEYKKRKRFTDAKLFDALRNIVHDIRVFDKYYLIFIHIRIISFLMK